MSDEAVLHSAIPSQEIDDEKLVARSHMHPGAPMSAARDGLQSIGLRPLHRVGSYWKITILIMRSRASKLECYIVEGKVLKYKGVCLSLDFNVI